MGYVKFACDFAETAKQMTDEELAGFIRETMHIARGDSKANDCSEIERKHYKSLFEQAGIEFIEGE